MPATTVIDYCTARIGALDAKIGRIGVDLQTLRGGERAQVAALTTARQAIENADQALRDVRAQLAAIALPAAGDPLLAQMHAARIARGKAASDLLGAEEALLQTRTKIATAERARDAAKARRDGLAQLQARSAPAHQARQALLAALAAAPRLPVQDAAAAANAGDGAAAETAVKLDMPEMLLNRLRNRRAHLLTMQTQMQNMRDALAAVQAQFGAGIDPATGTAAAAARLALVESRGRALTDEAAAQLASAARALQVLRARSARLTAEERTALASMPAATAELATRNSAKDKQAAMEAKLLAFFAADSERHRVLSTLEVEDPDDFPPATAGARKTAYNKAVGDANTAATELATADTGYSAKHRAAIDDWLACISDDLWDDVESLLASRAALQAIDAANPAALRTAILDAEQALVDSLHAEDKRLAQAQAAARDWQATQQLLANDPGAGGRRLKVRLRSAP